MNDPIMRGEYPVDIHAYRDLEMAFYTTFQRNEKLKKSLSWRITLPVRNVRRVVKSAQVKIKKLLLAIRNLIVLCQKSPREEKAFIWEILYNYARWPKEVELDYYHWRLAHPLPHLMENEVAHRCVLVLLGPEAFNSPKLQGCRESLNAQRECKVEITPLFSLSYDLIESVQSGCYDIIIWLRTAVYLEPDYVQFACNALGDTKLMFYADHDTRVSSLLYEKPFFKPGFSPVLLETIDYLAAGCALSPRWLADNVLSDITSKSSSNCSTVDMEQLFQQALYRNLRSMLPSQVVHLPACLSHIDASITRFFIRPSPREDNSIPVTKFLRQDISIIIPTAFHGEYLSRLLVSIGKTLKDNIDRVEIIVITCEPDDKGQDIIDLSPLPVKLIRYNHDFNFSAVNNTAVQYSTSDTLIFLNDDIELNEPGWVEALEELLSLPDAGAVGALLCYENGTIQHAGCLVGMNGGVGHIGVGLPADTKEGNEIITAKREVSAVTGACLAIRKSVFLKAGGFDTNLPLSFNDIALCLNLRKLGYTNYIATSLRITHHESPTRGHDDTPQKYQANREDYLYARRRYPLLRMPDPFYSPNLSLSHPFQQLGDPSVAIISQVLRRPISYMTVILSQRKDFDVSGSLILKSLSRASKFGQIRIILPGDKETRFYKSCCSILGAGNVELLSLAGIREHFRTVLESLLVLDMRLLELSDGLPTGRDLLGLSVENGRVTISDLYGDKVARHVTVGYDLYDIADLFPLSEYEVSNSACI